MDDRDMMKGSVYKKMRVHKERDPHTSIKR